MSGKSLKILACFFIAVAFVGCATAPRQVNDSPTARLATRAVDGMNGCAAISQPSTFEAATSAAAAERAQLLMNTPVTARLHDQNAVSFAREPAKRPQGSANRGGVIAFTAPGEGTYVIGSASVAWVDLVDLDQNRLVNQRSYEWVELCGRRMKAGIYELRPNARHLLQLSATSDPAVGLFVAGPLRD